jgi:hypothetical protein
MFMHQQQVASAAVTAAGGAQPTVTHKKLQEMMRRGVPHLAWKRQKGANMTRRDTCKMRTALNSRIGRRKEQRGMQMKRAVRAVKVAS